MTQPKRILCLLDYGTVDTDALRLIGPATGDDDHELLGLYVEDEDLHRAALLPGLTEVRVRNPGLAALEGAGLAEALRTQAQHVREAFERTARRFNLACSFQVVRGRTVEVVVEAAGASDLVMITRPLRSAGLRTRDARQFAPLLQGHSSVLFVNEPWSSGRCIVLLHNDGDPAAASALATARRLAATEALPLVIASPSATPTQDNERGAHLPSWSEDAIIALCEREDARLLVLSELPGIDWRDLVPALAQRLSCSLLKLGG